MINQKQLQGLIERIIICENIRDMYQEEGKRKNMHYYNGKVGGLYLAMEMVGYQRSTATGMVLMEREKKMKDKIRQERNKNILKTIIEERQEGKPKEEETKDDQQGKV